MGDDDTSNFAHVDDPEAASEGFELTKVISNYKL